MKKLKLLTRILLTFAFFLFTFQTFAAEEEEPKVSIQIKNEVDAYVQKGVLQPFHQSLYDLEGYQTVYWKFVKINQNFDNFKSLTEDQIRSFIHSYRSQTDETWNYLFKNLDIEPQYLEQGQIVGLYWDSFVEDSKDGYLYLIWTSMYSPSEFMNLLEIKESKKTYKLYDTKQDEEELNMNWYDSDFYNFRMWNLTLHITPIAGYMNQEHFGLPLKQKYSFEGFTAGLDDAQYGYEIDKEKHFDLTSTHKMEFDLGLTPKQDGKNSMQLVTHGYEIIKECEVQSHFDLNFGGYIHYAMFNTTIPIDKIYRVDVSYKITNDNKSWYQFFLPSDEHQIKKSLTCERVKAGIFGLSTYQGFQEGSYQSTIDGRTNYKYRLHLNYDDDAWNLFEGQAFYETDYKRVSEFQILRMNYLVDGKTYDVPIQMDTVEGDTLFILDPELILDTQTPYYQIKKNIDDFILDLKDKLKSKLWILWTILGVIGFIILVVITLKIKNFIRFIFPKKEKQKE